MATYKVIGGDQKEYGPATAEEVRRWLADGRLNSQSLVQTEGSSEWKPLGSFPEFATARPPQVTTAPAPLPPAPTQIAGSWSNQILARPAQIEVGHCLGLSWQLLTANFGLLFGASFFAGLILLVFQFTPAIGPIVELLLHGAIYGGLYLLFLRKLRDQPASMSDLFAGFSIAFGQLVLTGAITSLGTKVGLICCLVIPGLYLFIAWQFALPLVIDRRLEFWSAMELSRKVATRVWFPLFAMMVVAFLPTIICYVLVQIKISLAFVPALQEALASSQPDFHHLIEQAIELAKSSLPFIFLTKLVFILNLPFATGALMYAYEALFGTRTTSNP